MPPFWFSAGLASGHHTGASLVGDDRVFRVDVRCTESVGHCFVGDVSAGYVEAAEERRHAFERRDHALGEGTDVGQGCVRERSGRSVGKLLQSATSPEMQDSHSGLMVRSPLSRRLQERWT